MALPVSPLALCWQMEMSRIVAVGNFVEIKTHKLESQNISDNFLQRLVKNWVQCLVKHSNESCKGKNWCFWMMVYVCWQISKYDSQSNFWSIRPFSNSSADVWASLGTLPYEWWWPCKKIVISWAGARPSAAPKVVLEAGAALRNFRSGGRTEITILSANRGANGRSLR